MESGDRYLIKEVQQGALVAVIDGLGHGAEAARASERAAKTIETHAQDTVITIIKHCHQQLHHTRGVVMALASINADEDTVTWLSIGNVQGTLIRSDSRAVPGYETIVMRPGVVGYNLPPLLASVFSTSKDDLLILATDGISNEFSQRVAIEFRNAHQNSPRPAEGQISTMERGRLHLWDDPRHPFLWTASLHPYLRKKGLKAKIVLTDPAAIFHLSQWPVTSAPPIRKVPTMPRSSC